MRFANFIIFFTLFLAQLLGQEIPLLNNFSQKEYGGANQNWSIVQDKKGIVYIANKEGVLRYNGVNWQTIKINDQKLVRSLCISGDTLYIGAYGEFGFIDTRIEKPTYHSLNHLFTDPLFLKEEFWHIVAFNSKIYFQSFGKMYIYDNKKIVEQTIPGNIMFSAKVDSHFYLPMINGNLNYLENGKFSPVLNIEQLLSKKITSIISHKRNEILISTEEDGAYIYSAKTKLAALNHPINLELKKHQINKTIRLNEEEICFGTISNGVYIFNHIKGEYTNINKRNGLHNNTVLALHYGKDDNLWVGMDKGICKIELTSDIQQYVDLQGNLGTIYTYIEHLGSKYLGTNQGLYKYNSLSKDYTQVSGITGQVWNLHIIGDHLIVGHNTGSHSIYKDQLRRISNVAGGWHTIPIPDEENLLLQSTYNGLVVFDKENNDWVFRNKIIGLDGPIERVVMSDKYTYWLCGPEDQLRRIKLDSNYQFIVSQKDFNIYNSGLPSLHKLRMNGVGKSIYIFQNNQSYFYNDKDECFYPVQESNMESREVNNTIFKIYKNKVVLPNGQSYNIEVRDFYNSIHADSNFFVSITEDGYYKIAPTQLTSKPNAVLKLVGITFDNGRFYLLDKNNVFNATENNLIFTFENPAAKSLTKYQYILDGPVKNKSDWSRMNQVQLMNLPSGSYVLTIIGSDNSKAETTFSIDYPWYAFNKLWWAYLLFLAGILYLSKRKYDNELVKASAIIEAENARKLKEYLIELDNQKLREENLNKARDLANSTMESIKKNQILEEIKEELIEIRRHESTMTTKDFQKMMHQINQTLTTEKDNKLFDENFFELNESFFKKLLESFPEMTADDLKLAVYLKMNLSTKEIAPLFNISLRGLENKRYRLRKKLGLDSETNLTEFFIKM